MPDDMEALVRSGVLRSRHSIWMQWMATQWTVEAAPTIVRDMSGQDEHVVIPFPISRTKRRIMPTRPDYQEDIVSGF